MKARHEGDNNYGRVPEEIAFDENAFNDFNNRGVKGYQPGMYQQNPYQQNPYQQNPYQSNPYQNNSYQQGQHQQRQYQPGMYQPEYTDDYQDEYDDDYEYPEERRQNRREPRRDNRRNNNRDTNRRDKHDRRRESDNRRQPKNQKPVNKKRNKNVNDESRAPFLLRLIGGILFIIQIILTIATAILTVYSRMLPAKYVLVALGVLAFMVILNFILLRGGSPRKKFNVGMVFTFFTSVLLAFVIYYVYGGISTLESITGIKIETTVYGVYVREDDPAQDFSDVKNYTFATCFGMESNDSDDILDKLKKEIGRNPDTEDYPDMVSQMDSLLNGTTDAVLIGQSNVSTIADIEGYDDINDRIREIGTISITRVIRTAPSDNGPVDSGETFAIFISGIDTEGDVSARSRSDVNIIAIVNPSTHQILLVSTPRDYYVTLYGLPNGGSSSSRDKLTHAGNFGIDCSVETLSELYGVDIDYYFRVNFTGFRDIIDALGGVTVHSDYDFSYGGYSFHQGENELSGDAALCFARERHAFADGDRQRGRNQMAVIEAVIHRMTSPAILRNYADTMRGVEGSFTTSMPYELISGLVNDQLDNGGDWDVQKFSVTGYGDSCTTYSIPNQSLYVMQPDMDTVNMAREYIDAMYNDEVIHVEES